MKMKQIILDRLILEVTRGLRDQLKEVQESRDRVTADILRLQQRFAAEKAIFNNKHRLLCEEEEKNVKLERAARALYEATGEWLAAKRPSQFQKARSTVASARAVLEPHIDTIPF